MCASNGGFSKLTDFQLRCLSQSGAGAGEVEAYAILTRFHHDEKGVGTCWVRSENAARILGCKPEQAHRALGRLTAREFTHDGETVPILARLRTARPGSAAVYADNPYRIEAGHAPITTQARTQPKTGARASRNEDPTATTNEDSTATTNEDSAESECSIHSVGMKTLQRLPYKYIRTYKKKNPPPPPPDLKASYEPEINVTEEFFRATERSTDRP